MTNPKPRPTSLWIALGALALLLVVMVIILAPIAECPNCNGERVVELGIDHAWLDEHPKRRFGTRKFVNLRMTPCSRCNENGHVTFLSRWLWQKPEPLPALGPPLNEPRDLDPSKPVKR